MLVNNTSSIINMFEPALVQHIVEHDRNNALLTKDAEIFISTEDMFRAFHQANKAFVPVYYPHNQQNFEFLSQFNNIGLKITPSLNPFFNFNASNINVLYISGNGNNSSLPLSTDNPFSALEKINISGVHVDNDIESIILKQNQNIIKSIRFEYSKFVSRDLINILNTLIELKTISALGYNIDKYKINNYLHNSKINSLNIDFCRFNELTKLSDLLDGNEIQNLSTKSTKNIDVNFDFIVHKLTNLSVVNQTIRVSSNVDLNNVKLLDISCCKIDDISLSLILKSLADIEHVGLSYLNIKDELSSYIENYSYLKSITLQGNDKSCIISTEGDIFRNLEVLQLDDMSLSDSDVERILGNLDLNSVTHLTLDDNLLTEKSIDRIFNCNNLKSLKFISTRNNTHLNISYFDCKPLLNPRQVFMGYFHYI